MNDIGSSGGDDGGEMEKRTYSEFIKSKEIEAINAGIEFDESELNKNLMPFQRYIVAWVLRKGSGGDDGGEI